ncbi:hypothetical protein AYO38_01350 [bacterium SCGC AG-212-C10]|nr:hypothetical protein AYO38_01350 [bacterium SCGC AG-212-C10]
MVRGSVATISSPLESIEKLTREALAYALSDRIRSGKIRFAAPEHEQCSPNKRHECVEWT